MEMFEWRLTALTANRLIVELDCGKPRIQCGRSGERGLRQPEQFVGFGGGRDQSVVFGS